MSTGVVKPRRRFKLPTRKQLAEIPGKTAGGLDDRFHGAGPLRRILNKVFPDHWSFLLGEIALFSFVILLLTGVFLTLFFEPSQTEVVYNGSYTPLRGIEMSEAYESTLRISFDVRGGLVIRQMHHWAALLFVAAILVHAARVFFTGAFRKPRELNWIIGNLMFWLAFLEGFVGYSLPDDALSGTGFRIANAIVLSIPVVGSWVAFSLWGGEFPGTEIIPRAYIAHVLLIPAILVVLVTVHLLLVFVQKHTQYPGKGRTNSNVVGYRMVPNYVSKQAGFSMLVFAVVALLGGLVQINPIWLFGPYEAAVVSSASQPDWYVMLLDGVVRLMPPWELRVLGYTLPPIFWAAVALPGVLTVAPMLYPFAEARWRKDYRHHNLLERPRDAPVRTALGVGGITFWLVLTLSGANDVIAQKFDISLNAMTWAGRIGVLLLPPLAAFAAYRICLGLQQHDREVLVHGAETGIIKRDPDGRYAEIHQPLSANGHGAEYVGATVPKKMNRLGALPPVSRGFIAPVETEEEALAHVSVPPSANGHKELPS